METKPGFGRNAGRFLGRYGIFCAFALLAAGMAFFSPSFCSLSNIQNILLQVSVNGIIAVGMTLVIMTGGIDLSVGSVLALAGVVAAALARGQRHSVLAAVLGGLLAGATCGTVNGVLIAKRRLAPFIVTLGMMTIARGAALVFTDGRPVIELSDSYLRIGGGLFAGLPTPALIFLIVVLLGIFVLHLTRFGRHVCAVGGNELAAKISGVNTDAVYIVVYALCGALTGLAGIVLSSRVMSGSPAAGQGYELDAIAAVVIGGASLNGGIGSMAGTIAGVLIIGVMNNGLDLLNVSSYWQQIVKGAIIITAVLLDKKPK